MATEIVSDAPQKLDALLRYGSVTSKIVGPGVVAVTLFLEDRNFCSSSPEESQGRFNEAIWLECGVRVTPASLALLGCGSPAQDDMRGAALQAVATSRADAYTRLLDALDHGRIVHVDQPEAFLPRVMPGIMR